MYVCMCRLLLRYFSLQFVCCTIKRRIGIARLLLLLLVDFCFVCDGWMDGGYVLHGVLFIFIYRRCVEEEEEEEEEKDVTFLMGRRKKKDVNFGWKAKKEGR